MLFLRIGRFSGLAGILLLGCGASKDPSSSAPSDAGSESDSGGIVPDAADDLGTTPDGIDVQPGVAPLRWDTVPGATQYVDTQTFFGQEISSSTDITSELSFRIDKPTLGTFAANVFHTTQPPPITGVGATLLVTAEARGKVGHARITIVPLRMSGPSKDFLFESPFVAMPTPRDDTLLYQTAAGAGVGAEVTVKLRNDPENPGGVDATKFLSSVRARSEGWPKTACDPHKTLDPLTFTADTTPVQLCFELVAAQNDTIKEAASAGFYRVHVDVAGKSDGKVYETREVIFVVPPTDPRIR